jgi:hypothetical protein
MRGTGTPSEPHVAGAPRATIATRLHQREAIAITSLRANACGGHRDADHDHQLHDRQLRSRDDPARRPSITEGIDEEMESMRRVEQRVAEFAARRASELAQRTGPLDRP